MYRFTSSLLALASSFTGKFTPYQGVLIAPMGSGITLAATNRGAATIVCHDPQGLAETDQPLVVLPDRELVAACRGIKSARGRDIEITGESARVTTFFKTHNTHKDLPLTCSTVPFPPVAPALAQVISYWSASPQTSDTAGRYDVQLLLDCIKAMADETSSIVLSAFQGGPLRLQREDTGAVVFLMPQTAQPIPPLPGWLEDFSRYSVQPRDPGPAALEIPARAA